jgi:hypothetical protein
MRPGWHKPEEKPKQSKECKRIEDIICIIGTIVCLALLVILLARC